MCERDPTIVVGIGVVGEGCHGTVEVGVGDGDPLHGVPRATLLHLDDLPMPRKLIGDLSHA